MAKPGPKPKIGPNEHQMVYTVVSVGGSLSDAAAVIGVGRATLNDAMRRDAEFRKGVKKATAAGKMLLVERVGKSQDWKAAAWMLERKWGKEYGRREPVKIEHTGKDGGPIQTQGEVKHAVDYDAIESELGAIGMARRVASNN